MPSASADHGRSWQWCDWKLTTSFGCPTFLNFGKNYAGARDGFVYTYSPDTEDACTAADRMVLARASKDRLADRNAYEFLRALPAPAQPLWTKEVDVTQHDAAALDHEAIDRELIRSKVGGVFWPIDRPVPIEPDMEFRS